MKHAVLLVLAYAALVTATTLAPELSLAGGVIRPLWLVLAMSLCICRGTSVAVWAAVLGFASDCLRGSGPLGLDLVLCLLVVATLPGLLVRRATRSAASFGLLVATLVLTIDGGSLLVRGGLPENLPTVLFDGLLTTVAGLVGLLLFRSCGRLLQPVPLGS